MRPSTARTATKLPKLRTKPRHMVTRPHAQVRAASHTRGVSRLRMRLEGISLHNISMAAARQKASCWRVGKGLGGGGSKGVPRSHGLFR